MALVTGPDLDRVIQQLAADPRLVHLERLPGRAARFGDLALPAARRSVAARLPVERFWSHQAAAIDLARAGRSVVVATGTASGKSLCYQVPIAEASVAAGAPGDRAADLPHQGAGPGPAAGRSASSTCPASSPPPTTATPRPADRTWVRANANVVLTNPEMLHHGILPHHDRWATFLMRLQYVVVDELHVLRGVFGTHVAHLLRRLRRLCAHYGSSPTFVFSSATHRPRRSAGLRPVRPRRRRGHRRRIAARRAALRALEPGGRARRRPTRLRVDVRRPAARPPGSWPSWSRGGHRTIAFCRSRKGTELVAADVRRRLPAELADRVRPYRGGYLAGERREIEERAVRRAAPRRGGHHRARARHRRRRARRLRARRLPRHDRVDVAAGRAGRARRRRRRWSCSWPATTSSTSG